MSEMHEKHTFLKSKVIICPSRRFACLLDALFKKIYQVLILFFEVHLSRHAT